MKNKKSESINLIPVSDSTDFMGIRVNSKKVEIYYPKTLRLYKDDYKLILKYLKTIHLATEMEEQIKNRSNSGLGAFPVDSYLWIIKDFLENGYYYNREKQYSKNNGKIEWKRTLKGTPVYSNGNLIYTDIVTSKMSSTDDMISKIYKVCLKQSLNRIGWLFGYDFFIDAIQPGSISEMLYLTRKNLNETFEDVKRMRFSHMISILESSEEENMLNKTFTYGINNYYYVFEKMIDIHFDGVSNKKRYNPQGHWMINGIEKPKDSSNLRPDTILVKNDYIYILDAKMYKYGFTGLVKDLPETQSMQKQITYGDYIATDIDKGKMVRNAFIIPYNKELDKFKNNNNLERVKDSNLVYLGYAYVDWRNPNNPKPYDNIYTFLIDMTYLIEKYTDKNKYINDMCNAIEKLILER